MIALQETADPFLDARRPRRCEACRSLTFPGATLDGSPLTLDFAPTIAGEYVIAALAPNVVWLSDYDSFEDAGEARFTPHDCKKGTP